MIKFLAGIFTLFMCGIVFWADSGYAFDAISLLMRIPHGDKIAHFLLLGILSFLINSSLSCRKLPLNGYNILLGSLLIAVVISLEEFSQAFIPHRNFEILDIVCNYAGIFTFGKLALFYDSKNRSTIPV
ncbi:MAG: VanZ family protein [Saprospiraceae bacterium]|jgi:VanZ family protein